MEDGEVDREKATVPDSTSGDANSIQGLTGRLAECNIVDQERHTVEDPADIVNQEKETVTEWTIIFHVQEVANEAFLRGIPKESQLREWNVPIIFGRGKDVNILLNDERASRHHLELNGQLSINGQANFTIRNLSSSKGFIVNGQTITSRNQWNIVKTGDKITVASLSFELEIIPGENTQNFVLEFVHPQERNQNVEASVKNPSAVVFMPPMGPVSPGFMGGIAVPGTFQGAAGVHMGGLPMGGRIPVHGGIPASPVPMGTLPSNGGIPVTGYMPTGHIPGQQFTYMHYPPPPDDALQIHYDALKFFVKNQDKVNFVKFGDLRFLAYEAVGQWKELGRALRVPEFRLTSINLDHRKHSEKAYQMLLTWVCTNPYGATYEELNNALNDPTVGRSDLAEKYCSTKCNDQEIENKEGTV